MGVCARIGDSSARLFCGVVKDSGAGRGESGSVGYARQRRTGARMGGVEVAMTHTNKTLSGAFACCPLIVALLTVATHSLLINLRPCPNAPARYALLRYPIKNPS